MAPVLAYWNIRGLCESIRYLLHYVGEDFEDKRYVNRDDWMKEKFSLGLEFPNLPYYIDENVRLTQSLTILRYLARKYHLAGTVESERARIEMLEQQLIDLRTRLARVAYSDNFDKAKEDFLKLVPPLVEQLSEFLGSKNFFIGDELTYVDFLAYEIVDFYELFHPPIYEKYPNLKEYLKRFREIPQLQRYFKSPTYVRWPIFFSLAKFGGSGEEPKRS